MHSRPLRPRSALTLGDGMGQRQQRLREAVRRSDGGEERLRFFRSPICTAGFRGRGARLFSALPWPFLFEDD